MIVVWRTPEGNVVCPCGSPRVDIELHDFTMNKPTFNDIAYCIDCGLIFELITRKVAVLKEVEN